MDSKCVNYQFECQYCDPEVEKYVSATKPAMEKHYRTAHNIEAFCTNINELPDANLSQIFEKLPVKERLKMEQVCKKWHHVAKNHSWSNFRIFNDNKCAYWRISMMASFFDRCGPYLRHLTLGCEAETAITFLKMSPNVQHLSLLNVKMNDESLKKLAQTMPNLKSLSFCRTFTSCKSGNDYNIGMVECLKTMTCLEYLYVHDAYRLFDQYSFVQFPRNLKHLSLSGIYNADKILSWVAEECKDLKGLRLSCQMFETTFQAISKLKSLTHLAMSFSQAYAHIPESYNIDYVFKALTELQALEINSLDEMVITGITRYCKKLEHLSARDNYETSPEVYGKILRLASLPNLCSLMFDADFSNEQTTELVSRFIVEGNLQVVKIYASDELLEPELLFEILRRCKANFDYLVQSNLRITLLMGLDKIGRAELFGGQCYSKKIRIITLNFGQIDSELYSKICQVVDEVDERDKQEFPEEAHPMVEMEYYGKMSGNMKEPHKWFRLTDSISHLAAFEKWEYGWLSAGKPSCEVFIAVLSVKSIHEYYWFSSLCAIFELDRDYRMCLMPTCHHLYHVKGKYGRTSSESGYGPFGVGLFGLGHAANSYGPGAALSGFLFGGKK